MSSGVQQGGTRLSKDEVFDLLSNRRRRHALRYLRRNGESVEMGELAEVVAAREQDKSPGEVTSRERKRVYVALQQSHIPRMRDMELVETGSGGVTLTEPAPSLDMYLEIVPDNRLNWSEYYIGWSVVSGLLVLGSWVGVPPFSLLPNAMWAGVVTILFLVIAVMHVVHDRRMKLG